MRIDLHAHSNISDGTDAPAELVQAAATARLDVLGLTDHDTFDGLPEAIAEAERAGIVLVRGMELSCARNGKSVHLLAYGADPTSPALAAELIRVRGGRTGRLTGVLEKLAELRVPVSEEAVLAEVGDSPSIGRPHIADAMIKAGHVRDRQEAFDRFLADGGPAHVHRYAIQIERGIDVVHQAGGAAVIAHPWGRGRESLLPPEVLARLKREHGLDGIEVDHHDHDATTRAQLRSIAAELDLLMFGSSDYHGMGKIDHDLGSNTTDPEVYAELIRRVPTAISG